MSVRLIQPEHGGQAEQRQRGERYDSDPAEISRIAEEIRAAWGPRVQRLRVGRPRVKYLAVAVANLGEELRGLRSAVEKA